MAVRQEVEMAKNEEISWLKQDFQIKVNDLNEESSKRENKMLTEQIYQHNEQIQSQMKEEMKLMKESLQQKKKNDVEEVKKKFADL